MSNTIDTPATTTAAATATANACASDNTAFAAALVEHRAYLLRYAKRQLRNECWAEDVVSETLLAALAKPDNFANRSQLKTWLIAILKYKIIDQINRNARFVSVNGGFNSETGEDYDLLPFHWQHGSTQAQLDQSDPYKQLEQRQFFEILDMCITLMPSNLSRVFWLHECLGMSTTEICADLGIKPANLYIQLHRARVRLRACLNSGWFSKPDDAKEH
ncbi:MAG: sigma-70 family RNA polymerase sigma factor [Burkholderiaceae bacterium]